MARICLISPGHLSTNPRLVKEGLALKAAGHHIHVVHGQFSPWGAANDKPLADALGSTTAIPFGPRMATGRVYLRQTLFRKVASFAAEKITRLAAWCAEAAHSPVTADLCTHATAYKADLYIAHYVAALPAAARAAKRHGSMYAFDAEDFHLGDLEDIPKNRPQARLIEVIERRYLSKAAFVTAASPMIADEYARTYGIAKPTTILNVFSLRDSPPEPTPRGGAEPGPSLYWFSQTIGPGRGLETAIEAIRRAESRPHLYIRGTISPGYANQLQSLANNAGIGSHIHILDPLPPWQVERAGQNYDLGLVGEASITRSRQIALTNKLFSYLVSGVPIVASDIPAHLQIAPHLGNAISIFAKQDPSSLAGAMDELLLNPERLLNARKTAWSLARETYNWEHEQAKIKELVSDAFR